MSVTGLGSIAKCKTLQCDTLEAKNTPGGDPHLITGDLEVTGNLEVDGGITVDSAGFKGLNLKSKSGVNQIDIEMNENTNTWTLSADASSNAFFINHKVNTAGTGVTAIIVQYNTATGDFGTTIPAKPLQLIDIPTSAAGLTSGSVWSNAGVLNIIP